MTTREQIHNKEIDYSEEEENFLEYDDCGDVCDDKIFIENAFDNGAEYGYNLALEKVCEYIKENIDLYAYKLEESDFQYDYPLTERIVLTDNFEEDVKQAMKL